MTYEEFSQFASALQSIAVIVGVIVGAFWALFRFGKLKEIEKSSAELEALKQSMRERGAVNVELSLTQFNENSDHNKFVKVVAKVNNFGNVAEVLDWSDGGVLSRKVPISQPVDYELEEPRLTRLTSLIGDYGGTTIHAGSFREFTFLVPVEAYGVYMFTFYVGSSIEEREMLKDDHLQALGKKVEKFYWAADDYINVA